MDRALPQTEVNRLAQDTPADVPVSGSAQRSGVPCIEETQRVSAASRITAAISRILVASRARRKQETDANQGVDSSGQGVEWALRMMS